MSGVLIKGIVPSKFLEFFFDGVYFYPNLCKVEGFVGLAEFPLSARGSDPFGLYVPFSCRWSPLLLVTCLRAHHRQVCDIALFPCHAIVNC